MHVGTEDPRDVARCVRAKGMSTSFAVKQILAVRLGFVTVATWKTAAEEGMSCDTARGKCDDKKGLLEFFVSLRE